MPAAAPFHDSMDHLLAEVSRIDALVRRAARRALSNAPAEGEARGLYISDAEVGALIEAPLGRVSWGDGLDPPSPGEALAARAAAAEAGGTVLRFSILCKRFGLDRFDADVLLLCLLPELDAQAGRLMAYLQDDLTRRRPGVDLVLSLLCPTFEARLAARARFHAGAPLVQTRLLDRFADGPGHPPPLLGHSLAVSARIVDWLLGSDALDPAIAPYARAIDLDRAGDIPLSEGERGRLLRFVREAKGAVVYLEGPRGAGKLATSTWLCRELGIPLLAAEGRALWSEGGVSIKAPLHLITREARLTGAAIHWAGASALLDDARPSARASLLAALRDHTGLALLGGERAWDPAGALGDRPFLRVAIPRLGIEAQVEAWRSALAGDRALEPSVDIASLAGMFRFTPGRIRAAAAAARDLARYRDPDGKTLHLADITAACRAQRGREVGALARLVATPHTWADLALPRDREELLREIAAHARHRGKVFEAWGFDRRMSLGKGLGVLFSGPPGTGKTLAAGVLAGELGLDLLHIDLSAVVSKYIGETEKHLARLFDDAEETRAILFFDEADAIFGKRTEVKDAHDRYANVETSYLLQRIDAYEGMVILASNMAGNMDDAFVRRLRFVVDFPLPSEAERLRIWERTLPAELPRAPELDLRHLARRFEVSGGNIRNIALAAAFLAADEGTHVGMAHVVRAARREYLKMGKVVDPAQFALPRRE